MTEKYQPPFTITKNILALVSEISEVVGALDAKGLTPLSPQLRRGNLVKTITGTLAIEGNTLSLEQVSDIIDGKRVLGPVREIAEVHGAIKAYEALADFKLSSEADLLCAHTLLMDEVLSKAGLYRTGSVGINKGGEEIHVAPPAERVPDLVADLLGWLDKTDDHPLISSSVFHYEFEFIHPFADGNGRMGRLWQTLILSKWRSVFAFLSIENVIKEEQEGYYRALRQADGAADSAKFVEFMLTAILKICREAGQSAANVPINVPKDVPINRRKQIVSLIAVNPEITISQLAEHCQISTKTLKRDITKLKNESQLMRVESQKSGFWQIMQ